MPDVFGIPIMRALKLLTPDYISRVAQVVPRTKKVNLTKLINESEGASVHSEKFAEDEYKSKVLQYSKERKREKENNEIAEDASSTVFLLEEKQKSKKSQEVLKKKEVLELYQSESSVDLEHEKMNKESLQKVSNSGVLVNKKHY